MPTTTTRNPEFRKTCPETGCRTCVHCIPDDRHTAHADAGETGMVCASCAPMLYAILTPADLDGKGPINHSGGKPCREYRWAPPRKQKGPEGRTCGECRHYREKWTAREGQVAKCEHPDVYKHSAWCGEAACALFEECEEADR